MDIVIRCLGPIRLVFNNELLYRSNVIDEIKPDARVVLNLQLVKGWNSLLIQAKQTAAGFGCQLGADEAKVRILNVLAPFEERSGQAGWVYSEPTNADLLEGASFPDPDASEEDTRLTWHPRLIAERIADFMLHQLERREDGAFYRKCTGEYSENTMWADDLNMSTPFLCRYARITGCSEALDEAASQFLLFRKYLYMPDQQIMSHVYDFKYGMPTKIPWGRGNGWTLFSLTEVLEALPNDHEARAELVDFFNELCEGYAALQAASGLWHQVLNDADAYQEASCTGMFAYAFARGIRFGWLREKDKFLQATFRAWDGLIRHAIDRQGNVHGVCSGSRYAFTADYYKYDLLRVTNDNHGIGIMMLAGTEVAKLKQWLKEDLPNIYNNPMKL
ncbi:glycoside hydrolase family 88/105 protein [Paenibacillus sp. UNC451MF]|uniref:glycoside hydrolase family 88/105 protein n=1 Tax=Paenibacillus sp. UNC451MF TaxID=1449063 RepID=UPI000490B8F9|nr:glycoside hydrolase family 88 protein [Paenibacillus sp. UNC451MF]